MTSTTTQSVVILGGGPAGLTAAYRLARLGYRVTIIDRRPLLGGARTSEDLCDAPEPFTILGWDVPNIQAAVKDLGSRGVVFERYPGMEQDALGIWTSPSRARVAWFRDPEGNTLSVTQY